MNSNRREAVLDAGVDASFNSVAKVAHRGADGCGSAAFVAKGTSDVRDVRGGAAGETYVNAKAAGTVVEGGVSGWEAGVGIIVVNSVGRMVPVESRAMQVSVRSWREEAMIRAVREVTVRGGLSWCWAIHEVDWPTRVSLRVRMFGSLRRGRTGKLGVGV